jgi:hypothetical protein
MGDDPLLDGADRRRVLQGIVAQRHRGGQVDPARLRHFSQVVEVRRLDELHLQAQARGEGRHQVMLEAAGRGVRALLKEGGRLAHRDDQFAFRFGRLDARAGERAGQDKTADQAKQFRQRFPSL